LATDMGINLYDSSVDGFKHFIHDEKNENSVIHNEILCFHEDANGKLWIGTYGKGFDKLDPVKKTFTHFSDISDVTTAVIYGILEDTHGYLWMSTNNGILKFNEKTLEVKKFSIEDGLQSNEFNGTSYFINNTGEMFFGGQFGFNSFYPNEVQVDTITPKIIFSDLLVHNVSVIPGESSPLNSHIAEAKEILLNHKQNNFTLYFSALHFANSERNSYRYKLEGFDKDWIDAGNKRFVTYTNLPYKTYKFTVMASNSDGIWNTNGISIRVKITPPIWATIWFRIMMGLLVTGGLIYIVRRRLTRDERHKRIIEEKLNASSKELEEARHKLEQQHSEIIIQKRELVAREKDQENLLWFNEGLGKFSDLISRNRENLSMLCKEFIENLSEYVEAQQGGIFLFNDEDETDPHLELVASYVFTASRTNQRFKSGEGYVGTCYRDKKFIEIDNLSENYSELSSGLGSMHIKYLVLAPLMVNDDCIGVVELGSFKKIRGYRIALIEKLVEIISSTIFTDQANTRLKKLIEQSTKQAR
ncbi:MAG: GAF domain-containing protein, partial [Alphaproteobacteria bacterium]